LGDAHAKPKSSGVLKRGEAAEGNEAAGTADLIDRHDFPAGT